MCIRDRLTVGGSLLERVELAAVEILQKGVTQQVIVMRAADDGRNALQASGLSRPPASLAHDQLIAHGGTGLVGAHRVAGADPSHHDRLKNPDLRHLSLIHI